MTSLVADASVAIKWFSPFRLEALASQARGLLDRWQQGAIELIARTSFGWKSPTLTRRRYARTVVLASTRKHRLQFSMRKSFRPCRRSSLFDSFDLEHALICRTRLGTSSLARCLEKEKGALKSLQNLGCGSGPFSPGG